MQILDQRTLCSSITKSFNIEIDETQSIEMWCQKTYDREFNENSMAFDPLMQSDKEIWKSLTKEQKDEIEELIQDNI